jgi:hypothetical protein
MSKIIKSNIIENIAAIELENGTKVILQMKQNDKCYEFSFYQDEDLELNYSNTTFVFTDESVSDEDDENNFYNPSKGNSYLLREMTVPSGLEKMGIGEFIVRWVLEVSGANIWAWNPSDGKSDDERNLTDKGLKFVLKLQEKGLIQNWD